MRVPVIRGHHPGTLARLSLPLFISVLCTALFIIGVALPRPAVAQTGSGNQYYVSPSGSNTNPGTLASPWKTLKYALGKLAAGDTLYLRGGTYYEGSITTSLKGTGSQPITITSYPGERAVIDGGVPDYKTVPNTGWELVGASIGLYRTTKTYSGTVGAWLINDDTQLIQYAAAANLESTNYVLNGGNMYFGPGVQLRSDGKVYIRLQPNPEDLIDAYGNSIPPLPIDPNPNNNSISVFTTQTLLTLQGAAHLHFKDITFQYARRIMDLQNGTNNITLDNCIINFGTHGILASGADSGEISRCEFNNGVPMTMYWTDVKNDEVGAGNEPYPEFQSVAVHAFSNLNIHDNTFRRSFDGISLHGGVANVTIRNNYFLEFKDDAINLSLDNSNIEIAHNLFWYDHAGISLFNHTGTPGDVYIHHNVLDGSMLTRTGRPGNYRENSYPPWAGGNPFAGHGGKSAAHWKVYNNTFISHKGRQLSTAMGPGAVIGNSGKYLYNNIFYVHDNRIVLGDDQESSGSHYDGNVFWQGTSGTMFDNFANGRDYASLAALRGSGTSWESKGLQLDPGFNRDLLLTPVFDKVTMWGRYVPANGQVFTTGMSYTGLSWPETAGITYRGAVPGAVTGTLEGYVTDALTGGPINGATVTAGGLTDVTAADGSYQISGLPAGTYDVTASASGYAPRTISGVTVVAGGAAVQDLALLSGCVSNCLRSTNITMRVTGTDIRSRITVTNENSLAVSGATVSVTWSLPDGSTQNQSRTTNTSGVANFRVTAVGPGTYLLSITTITKTGYTFDLRSSILSSRVTRP